MPPYELLVEEQIFTIDGRSSDHIEYTIHEWLNCTAFLTDFYHYDYVISAGRLMMYFITSMFEDGHRTELSRKLDMARIKLLDYHDSEEANRTIRITWRKPVVTSLKMSDCYITAFKNPLRPDIKKVIYNDPATIIFWEDGTKTVVQCQKGDDYDPEKGLVMAIAKKALGNTSRALNDVLHKWEKKEEPSIPNSCNNCKYGDLKLSKEPCKSCDSSSWSNWAPKKV